MVSALRILCLSRVCDVWIGIHDAINVVVDVFFLLSAKPFMASFFVALFLLLFFCCFCWGVLMDGCSSRA